MKTWLVAGLVALAMALGAFQSLPRCTAMDPDTGKRKNLGTFRSREEAKKHERAIQFFKHRP